MIATLFTAVLQIIDIYNNADKSGAKTTVITITIINAIIISAIIPKSIADK